MDGSITIGIELRDQKFSETLSRLRRSAEQTALQGFQTLVNSLNSIASAFAHTASAGAGWRQQMRGVFNHVSAGAASLAPMLLSAGRSAGYQFMNGILSVDSTGAGRSLAQKALAGFSIGGYQEAGAAAAAQIAGGLNYGEQSILYYARNIAHSVGNAFSGGWYSVGYNIASGVAYGIYGGSGAIRAAAVSAAQSALYWAKRALGIRSPSRVFRDQVGRMIPAGIAEGITRGQQTSREALRRQSQDLVRTARQNVIPAVVRSAGENSPVSAASGDREMRIRLEAPLYVDGRELARATAKYTGQQLVWEAMG
ncbi:MAG: hypothetical protein IJ206_10625 [Oscillospiraceae bacterium]|nr:hypothetical protein [Oscillospiraceae bacterium]